MPYSNGIATVIFKISWTPLHKSTPLSAGKHIRQEQHEVSVVVAILLYVPLTDSCHCHLLVSTLCSMTDPPLRSTASSTTSDRLSTDLQKPSKWRRRFGSAPFVACPRAQIRLLTGLRLLAYVERSTAWYSEGALQ